MRKILALAVLAAGCGGKDALVVGSKPFTESEIVGEMLAQLAEADGVSVDRKFHLGEMICFNALKSGTMDAYVEYTGTGLVNYLNEKPDSDAGAVFERVRSEFEKRWNLEWMEPLGFNNTYALVMKRARAAELEVRALSDLKKKGLKLNCGFDLAFHDRPDGYKGLVKHYGMEFCAGAKNMDPGLMYSAVAGGRVDLISGYATDGRIRSLGLVALEDDLRFFPPYHAAPLVGPRAFAKAPGLRARLDALAGKISDAEMTRLNAEVDEKKRPVRAVAGEFLKAHGLL